MATFYGSWVATDDFRAILEATVSNTSDTQCTVKLVLKLQSNYAYAGSSGRASVTCNGTTRSDSVSYDAGRTTTLMTETFTVARGSAKKSVSVSGKVWQLNSSSAYAKGSTASGKVTIPAIDYDAPSAPSSCAASRASDTQAKVTWKNGSTSATKPRSSTKVERQADGGEWEQVASVGANTTSYTDNSISANHRYRYRVRAQGAGGYSGYSTSGYIYTTPAAPASVTASVTQGTSVRIAVDGSNAPWAESWEVQSSLNGGEWTAVGTYTSFPQTADIGGGTVRLRARSLRGSLASAWTESAEITTITPPLAPTVTLTPSGVVPTGTDVTVAWVPSHPDGSAQTQAQVEYTVGDGGPQTATVEGAATSYQLPSTATASPAAVSVRVRTHGADEDWGAWSEPVTLTVAEPPSVAITSPGTDGAVVADLPLEAAWTVSDPTGVAAQTFTLYDASGRAIHTAQLAGSARSYELGPSTYMLTNSAGYTLRLDVTGGSSLTASEERDFRTSFAEPSAPTVDAEVDESDMSVELTVHAGLSSTEAGEVVEVPDHAPAGTPVPGFTVFGNTRQNLWVNPRGTNNGVTSTANEDGSFTASGTNNAQSVIYISGARTYALRDGMTYTASIDKVPVGFKLQAQYYDDDGYVGHAFSFAPSGATKVTFTANFGEATLVAFFVQVDAGSTVSGTYRVMLNEGSEAEPWCPPGLNGVDELSIVTAGKNLLARMGPSLPYTTAGITFSDNGDGGIRVSGTATANAYYNFFSDSPAKALRITPGEYTASLIGGGSGLNLNVEYYYGGIGGSRTSWLATNVPGGSNTGSIDRPVYLRPFLSVAKGKTVDTVVYPQLELGTTATTFEPPVVTSTPIDLDGHTLNSLPDGTCDELTIDATGAVTLTKRVGAADLTRDSPVYNAATDGEYYEFTVPATSDGTGGNATTQMCDRLPIRNPDNSPYRSVWVYTLSSTGRARIGGMDGDEVAFPTSSDLKTFLGADGVTVLYALATPETIELPGVTLPSWPDGPATLWASAPVPTEMRVDYPDVDGLTVQRVNADGSLWTVGDGLADGETVVDPLPPLNTPVDYVITAHTAAGATSELRITETLQALVGAFNFGQAAGTCELAELNPDWSHDVARSGTLYHFADGGEGGGLPVAYGGQDVDATRSMGFTLLDLDQLRRLQELARQYFTCWYRDPYGGRALCSVSWSFSSGIPYDMLKVSASMTETVFEEAW